MSCVFLAILRENSPGLSNVESSGSTFNDSLPPIAAAIASTVPRSILTYGSNTVLFHEDVLVSILIFFEDSFRAPYSSTTYAHKSLAARSFAISMK
jgi:hypothetical protein